MLSAQPATGSQKTFVESGWKKAPKYAQGEMTQDVVHSWLNGSEARTVPMKMLFMRVTPHGSVELAHFELFPTTVREGVLLSVRSTFGEEPYFHVNLKSFLPTVSTWFGSLDTARGQ